MCCTLYWAMVSCFIRLISCHSFFNSYHQFLFTCSEQRVLEKLLCRYTRAVSTKVIDDSRYCQVTAGANVFIVRIASAELCVKRKQSIYSCECNTYKRINICSHNVAVVISIKDINFKCYMGKSVTMSSLVGGPVNAGKKPGTGGRRGGRVPKPRPVRATALAATAAPGYILVRKSSRISVCRGCKVNFNIYDRFVIRHACSLPFHQKDQVTGEVYMRWSRIQNHHFHVMRNCIIKDPHHRDFVGNVAVEDSVQVNQPLKDLCRTGNIVMRM